MQFSYASILSTLAFTSGMMSSSALNADIYTYKECDNATLSAHGVGGASHENSILWHHPGGVSSIYNNDLGDVLCRAPTAVVDELKSQYHEVVQRDCDDCGKSCLGYPCTSAGQCSDKGCTLGCSVRYECALPNCPGMITACV
ncbi:hypothetical protein BGW36DRAFT_368911 [Talaromyces proteolyticus]|uniref:Uncharacterized protein n=1 Tax=Talaromyces proteolyticus TaxID=1131652 RepID=A0AAD4Q4J3_9EURO|nr:uncharacterized protein BGW36DRAFT_368911 [Talaromyces proteolyticus]KAH8703159.1 hypothetical protein BGW36DRAFT_368911 [Talaromyces proteolyticus]